jgi:hypothetical protein
MPHIQGVSRDAVAEKFQAMVKLGMVNSRMKDFYDLWFLSQKFPFEGELLSKALIATFDRRKTLLPKEAPLALTPEFYEDSAKQKQWKAFIDKGNLRAEKKPLSELVAIVQGFLMPPSQAIARGEPFEMVWQPPGSWELGVHL